MTSVNSIKDFIDLVGIAEVNRQISNSSDNTYLFFVDKQGLYRKVSIKSLKQFLA